MFRYLQLKAPNSKTQSHLWKLASQAMATSVTISQHGFRVRVCGHLSHARKLESCGVCQTSDAASLETGCLSGRFTSNE